MSDARLDALIRQAESEGVQVIFQPLLGARRGAYLHSTREIYINSRMTERNQVATLAHEMVHARYGHEGRQFASVEKRVDELAAMMLINTSAYAMIEEIYGPHPGTIARELDLPVWVVEAWQRNLNRTFRVTA